MSQTANRTVHKLGNAALFSAVRAAAAAAGTGVITAIIWWIQRH